MAFDPSTARPLAAVPSTSGGDDFELPPLEPVAARTTRFDPSTARPYSPPLSGRVKGWAGAALSLAEPELAGAAKLLQTPAPTPSPATQSRRDFIDALRPHAERVGARLGIAPEYLIAQAAQETGWGKHVPGNNLFGIKGRYRGQGRELGTTEGAGTPDRAVFKAYPSLAESFDDLGATLGNPRYAAALHPQSVEEYGNGLKAGGYATDPNYARNIGDRLREYREALGQAPTAGDYGRVLAGSAGALVPETLAGLGRMELGAERALGVRPLGRDARAAVFNWLGDLAKSTREYWQSGMSPAGREQLLNGELIRGDTDPATGETSYALGGHPGQAILSGALESAPGVLAMGGLGKAALSGLGFTAEQVAAKAVEHGIAPGLAGWLGKVATSGAAYGGAEGLISGAQDAEQTFQDFMAIPPGRYTRLPAFRAAFLETDRDLPLLERQGRAWRMVAERAALDVGAKAGAVVGLTSAATGGGMFRALEAPSRTAVGGMAKNAWVEAGQEAPQSGYEQWAQNEAKRDYLDPNQSLWEGVPNAVATGAAVGGLLGGVTGGFTGGGASEPARTAGEEAGSATVRGAAPSAPETAPGVDSQAVGGATQPVAPASAAPGPVVGTAPTDADYREAVGAAREKWDRKLSPQARQVALDRLGISGDGWADTAFFELPQEVQGILVQARLRGMRQEKRQPPPAAARPAKTPKAGKTAPAPPPTAPAPYDEDVPLSWPTGGGGPSTAVPGPAQAPVAAPAGPAAQSPDAKLPADLAGAKPRFGYRGQGFGLDFESDLDKAAYITAQATKSKRDADYLRFVQDHTGWDGPAVRAYGASIRERVKAMAKAGDPAAGALRIVADKPASVIDQSAHTAATSPRNPLPEPSQAQKEAGNYPKGHVRAFGLDLSIENPEGSERKGVDPGGKPWSVRMRDHYGYIKGTVGKDKDPIDLFIKPGTSPDPGGPLFVVDQVDGDGRFDEHKVMAGYSSRQEAERAYLRNYARGWKGLGAMTEMSPDGFKSWLASGKTRRPAAESGPEGARPDDPVPTGGSVGEPGSGRFQCSCRLAVVGSGRFWRRGVNLGLGLGWRG
ncbi:glucosaminidase domain-containing protein [Methylomagnum ishizawai]|uniref:glucosaminidase domain-containing protein n=1 Tax=Methylomagnum ishizawai TaxID=1760988 RepID=UPI001C32EC24|nr:glucosaminidase domain-containing protein [Methylomagnum ishizawai]BBL74191.1 hypothetical protein MishRS11D_12890 [Methylomagnum ishizawai]